MKACENKIWLIKFNSRFLFINKVTHIYTDVFNGSYNILQCSKGYAILYLFTFDYVYQINMDKIKQRKVAPILSI